MDDCETTSYSFCKMGENAQDTLGIGVCVHGMAYAVDATGTRGKHLCYQYHGSKENRLRFYLVPPREICPESIISYEIPCTHTSGVHHVPRVFTHCNTKKIVSQSFKIKQKRK